MDIKIPPLGEGASTGTVINILVKEGDTIKKDQTVIELENEKAVAPIPSTQAGTVSKILVSVGTQVTVGQSIITLAGSGSSSSVTSNATPQSVKSSIPQQMQNVSVAPKQQVPEPVRVQNVSYQPSNGKPGVASPMIRRIARQIGLDLARVSGSERGGRIVLEDVKNYIQYLQSIAFSSGNAEQTTTGSTKPASPVSIDFSKWGSVKKNALSPLRKKIAEKMHESWSTIPHVTQNDEVDVTDLMKVLKNHAASYEKEGARLTLTAVILKACVQALKKYPQFNSSLDEATNEFITKEYFHLGVAVDTEQGLIVPVLRDVDTKNLLEISKDLSSLAEKTRQRKVGVEDLKGGTFTISNLGGIGGKHFTPIINKPEVAILGVSRGAMTAVVRDGKIVQRSIMPISVSYDHRVIDGADGARFIREIATAIENFKESDIKLNSSKSKSAAAKKSPVKSSGKAKNKVRAKK